MGEATYQLVSRISAINSSLSSKKPTCSRAWVSVQNFNQVPEVSHLQHGDTGSPTVETAQNDLDGLVNQWLVGWLVNIRGLLWSRHILTCCFILLRPHATHLIFVPMHSEPASSAHDSSEQLYKLNVHFGSHGTMNQQRITLNHLQIVKWHGNLWLVFNTASTWIALRALQEPIWILYKFGYESRPNWRIPWLC